MYRCDYFKIQELVPKDVYDTCAANGMLDRLWVAFDGRILAALDNLRRRFGPLTVNTWAAGGNYTESGLRSMSTTTGAYLSQHKFGRAIDFRSRTVTPAEIYDDLVKSGGLKAGFVENNKDNPWALVSRLEYYPGITWTHIDVSHAGNSDGSILVFNY